MSSAAFLQQLSAKFNPAAAAAMDEVFQFEIENSGSYHLIVRNQSCNFNPGEHPDPSVTLIMDKTTLKELLSGQLGGMQAFMSGKVRTEGNLILATKLKSLFTN